MIDQAESTQAKTRRTLQQVNCLLRSEVLVQIVARQRFPVVSVYTMPPKSRIFLFGVDRKPNKHEHNIYKSPLFSTF